MSLLPFWEFHRRRGGDVRHASRAKNNTPHRPIWPDCRSS